MADHPVSVEADLYVVHHLNAPDLWGRLESTIDETIRGTIAFREQEIVARQQQDLPDELAGWRHMVIDVSPSDVAARAPSRMITAAGLAHLPDTLGWTPLRLVSTRLRDALLDIFPQGSSFYPAYAQDGSFGDASTAVFWYWLPRHFLRFKGGASRGKEQMMRPKFWGALNDQYSVWEMHHNAAFHAHVAELPFWTPSPSFTDVVFRSDVYRSLKSAGFTGFYEAVEDNYLVQRPEDSVGYVQFAK